MDYAIISLYIIWENKVLFRKKDSTDETAIVYKNYYKPAKYLIPAAIFAAIFTTGCDPDAPVDGTISAEEPETSATDSDSEDNSSVVTPGPVAFKSAAAIALNGGISSFDYYIYHPNLADIDGDGDCELYVGYSGKDSATATNTTIDFGISFFSNMNSADKSFTRDTSQDSVLPAFTIIGQGFYPWLSSVSAVGGMFTTAGNVDLDADLEIIAAGNFHSHWYSDSSYPPNDTDTSRFYKNTVRLETASQHFKAPVLVDIDGDNDLDIVIGETLTGASRINYNLNEGDGNFTDTDDGTLVTLTTPSELSSFPIPSFVDVDADGDQDMFTVDFKSGGISFYRNTGGDLSTTFSSEAIPSNFDVFPDDGKKYFPAFGDVDGDTDIDIIVGTDDATLLYFENTSLE